MRFLRVAYPAWARARQHGQFPRGIASTRDPVLAFEELTRMLEKREVPREGGVVYVFEAKRTREGRDYVEDLSRVTVRVEVDEMVAAREASD